MAASHFSPYAGTWYPGHAGDLERLVEDLFERSRERTGPCKHPEAVAFVVPHAGLQYSGAVAATACRQLAAQKPNRIILLGFSHRGGPPAVALPDVDAIATPLGEVKVDRATLSALAGREPFRAVAEKSVCDHSVEIQLPLLAKAAPGIPVAPLYVGPLDAGRRRAAAEALADLAAPGTVFLASSDLTHYGRSFDYVPFPPDDEAPGKLKEIDEDVIEAAGSLDPGFFLDHLARTGSTVCGYDPIALLLETLPLTGPDEVFQDTLDYQTSGEITGDYSVSVGYGALGYFRAGSLELRREDQTLLLASARETLAGLLETGQRKPVPPRDVPPALMRQTGVFVTLHEGGRLRGCVGRKCGREPLAEAVPQLTLAAALDDSRFEPLRTARAPVEIEISVLTPLKRVRDGARFRIGLHGGYLEAGYDRGLLLPQVGSERGWTAEEFLKALARKAGLPPEGGRNPAARLYVFQAQVFNGEMPA